jgi:S1-C subfamily serine protease
MQIIKTIPAALATLAALAAVAPAAGAQGVVAPAMARGGVLIRTHGTGAIGVTTTGGTSSRDTLGVFVSVVRAGSPADKAGIQEGDRIASIDGVSLRLAAADVGAPEEAGVMSRRLTRELDKVKAGDDVALRVYSSGQWKDVHVKAGDPDDVYRSAAMTRYEQRPTLGLNVGVNGSRRDSLGMFVMSVVDGGPADKAGIVEGSRIASINGVDVRPRRDDDDFVRMIPGSSRLQQEIGDLKPGDDAELRVYYNGQYRTVKVKVAKTSDLPRTHRSVTIIGGDGDAPFAGGMNVMTMDGDAIAARVRRAADEAMTASGRAMANVAPLMARMGVAMGNRVEW